MTLSKEEKLKIILKRGRRDPVYFFEKFFYDINGKPYKLEPQQKLFLRDPSQYRTLFFSRRSGKSLVMVADCLWKSFYNKNKNSVMISPTLDQAKTLANTFSDIVARSPLLKSSFTITNKLDKQLDNNSRIKFATAGAASGEKQNSALVGSSVNYLYLDEIQALDSDAMATILPIITGQRGDPYLTYAGTPRGRTGFLYGQLQHSKTISEVYVNNGKPRPCPNGGSYSLHKFKICEVDENDNVILSRADYRLSIDELETMKSTIGVEAFKREYCLEFLDDISMPYYEELRQKAGILKAPTEFRDYQVACAGIDFGKKRNNSILSIGVFNETTSRWEIKYYYIWELGTQYNVITHYLNNVLPVRFPGLAILDIDGTGVGQSISESINHDAPYEVNDIIFSQPSKVNLNENAIRNLESGDVVYYPHELLEKEMSEYSRELTSNGRVVYKKGVSDDFIDSFTLCNLAITKYMRTGMKKSQPLFVGGMDGNILNDSIYRSRYRQNHRRRTSYARY